MDTPDNAARIVPRQELPRLIYAGAAAVCLCVTGALNAGETHATLMVSVTVPPLSRLEIISQPTTVRISTQDLERGYVEISEPTLLDVHSNAHDGYAIEVLPMTAAIQAITVRGMGSEADLGAEGGRIVQRWQHPQHASLALTYRLALAPGLRPGLYPWPLHLALEPISDSL